MQTDQSLHPACSKRGLQEQKAKSHPRFRTSLIRLVRNQSGILRKWRRRKGPKRGQRSHSWCSSHTSCRVVLRITSRTLLGTPWSAKPSQQKSAKPHARWRQAHAKLVPSKALFLPSSPWGPFLVWKKPALPRQAIGPSSPCIILMQEKKRKLGNWAQTGRPRF